MVQLLEEFNNNFIYDVNLNLTYNTVPITNSNNLTNTTKKAITCERIICEDIILTNKEFNANIIYDNNGTSHLENYKEIIDRIDKKLCNMIIGCINKLISDNYTDLLYILSDQSSGKNKSNENKQGWSHYFTIMSDLVNNYTDCSQFLKSCFTYKIRVSNHMNDKGLKNIRKYNQLKISSIVISYKDFTEMIQQLNRVIAVHSNLIRYILVNTKPINSITDIPNKYIRDINKYKIQ